MVGKDGFTVGAIKFFLFLAAMLVTLLALGSVCFAAEYKVSTPEEIASVSASAKPGDTLIMKNGTWENVQILFKGKGTEQQPITLRAETPGQVIIKGESGLKIAGSYLVVDGLVFKNVFAKTKIGLIDFSNRPAVYSDHCRLTNTVMEDCNSPEESTDYKWVSLYGQYNRVDHCYFRNKTNIGTLLVVWRDDDSANYHQIDHNYFGYTARHSENGGEAIRVGDSNQSLSYSYTTVENNYFEHCNGDIEVISNKSGGNVYRNNTFFENEGSLCLRHGNGCTVEGNFFLQNHLPISVGVRVMGEDHKIINNYFYGIGPSEGTMRSAIDLINGIPDSPLNGYYQVKNLLVANNTFVDNERNIMIGGGKNSKQTLSPLDCKLVDNIVVSRYAPLVNEVDKPVNMTYKNNYMYGSELGVENKGGFILMDPKLAMEEDGIYRSQKDSPAISAGFKSYTVETSKNKPLTSKDVGPSTIKINREEDVVVKMNGKSLRLGQAAVIEDGKVVLPLRSLAAALGVKVSWDAAKNAVVLAKPGTLIMLKPGEKVVDVNGKAAALDVPAKTVNDRVMVSVKFVNDYLANKAQWDEKTKTMIVESDTNLVFDPEADKAIADLLKAKADAQSDGSSIPVVGVSASSDDGNIPANTLDGDMNTRWAASGIGEWIEYDLGTPQSVGYVGISFNKGDERVAFFQIEVSNDKNEWKTVFDGVSSGKTKDIEVFTVEPINARYIKFIGKGTLTPKNVKGEWFSIYETLFFAPGENAPELVNTNQQNKPQEKLPAAVTYTKPGLYEPNGTPHIIPEPKKAAGKTLNVVDFGADPKDNESDDTAAINAAIAAAAAGDEIYFPNGVYNLYSGFEKDKTTNIVLKSGVNLRGESESGVILRSHFKSDENKKLNTSVIKALGQNNILISNMTVSSYFDGKYSTDSKTNNPEAEGVKYGIYIEDSSGIPSAAILIDHVTVENFQRMGVRISNSHDIVVRNSTFQKATDVGGGGAGYGISIQGAGNGINRLGYDNDCRFNLIEDNKFVGPYIRHGTLLQYYAHSNLIRNNTYENTVLDAIDLHGEDEYLNEIAGNSIKDVLGGGAIGVGNTGATHDSSGPFNYIHDNNIVNCREGIRVYLASPDTRIENNTITGFTLENSVGIYIQNGPRTIVKGNKISGNTAKNFWGILLEHDNGVDNGDGKGIVCAGDPTDVQLVSNVVQNNSNGIKISAGSGIIEKDNVTKDNSGANYVNDTSNGPAPTPEKQPVPQEKPKASGGGAEKVLFPADDTYIEKGKDTPNSTADIIRIKGTEDLSILRITYIKFKIDDPASINSATFQISGKLSDKNPDGAEYTYEVYGITDDSWSEKTAIWTNTPNHDPEEGTAAGVGDTAVLIGTFTMSEKGVSKPYNVDVTDYVKSHPDEYITFMIVDTKKQNGNTDNYSKERKNEAERPRLIIK